MSKSVLVVYETYFQYSICKYVVKKYYSNCDITWIGIENHIFKQESKTVLLDNSLFGSVFGFKEISLDVVFENIYDTIIGTCFTSPNGIFFWSNISAMERVLIDDGVSTYGFLSGHKQNMKSFLKDGLIRLSVLIAIRGLDYFPIQRCISSVTTHYTIYDYVFYDHTIKIPFPIAESSARNNEVCSSDTDAIAVVGQPLVDKGRISSKLFIEQLRKISAIHGSFDYYPHPTERFVYTLDLPYLRVSKTNSSIESYFCKNGFPKMVIGWYSTSLVNIKMLSKSTHVFYIQEGMGKFSWLYEYFNQNGLKFYTF